MDLKVSPGVDPTVAFNGVQTELEPMLQNLVGAHACENTLFLLVALR